MSYRHPITGRFISRAAHIAHIDAVIAEFEAEMTTHINDMGNRIMDSAPDQPAPSRAQMPLSTSTLPAAPLNTHPLPITHGETMPTYICQGCKLRILGVNQAAHFMDECIGEKSGPKHVDNTRAVDQPVFRAQYNANDFYSDTDYYFPRTYALAKRRELSHLMDKNPAGTIRLINDIISF